MSEIDSMGLNELKELAVTLDVTHAVNIGEDALRKKLQAKLGEPVEEPELAHPSVKDDEDRVTIIIAENEKDKQAVPVGLNGKTYLIQRGKPVSIPKDVLAILNNAQQMVWDGSMKKYAKVPRYPYTVAV